MTRLQGQGRPRQKVDLVFVHPKYKKKRSKADLALIRLGRGGVPEPDIPKDPNDDKQKRRYISICLDEEGMIKRGGIMLELAGWGAWVEGSKDVSPILRKARLPYDGGAACDRYNAWYPYAEPYVFCLVFRERHENGVLRVTLPPTQLVYVRI